jgi:hypothetical protein
MPDDHAAGMSGDRIGGTVTTWEELRRLIEEQDETAVFHALGGLDQRERRQLAGPLRRYERESRADPRPPWPWQSGPKQRALAVAGAGILPGAAVLAPWLVRNTAQWDLLDAGPNRLILAALAAREPPWLGDLATRLAARLSRRLPDRLQWRLARDLAQMSGIAPPTSDGFVIQWAREMAADQNTLSREIRDEPRTVALIPRMFEIEAVAMEFTRAPWPLTLRGLAEEGLLDRAGLLDSCVAALQRGGRLQAMRGCLRVHDALAPGIAEVPAADYLAMLPGSWPAVAAMARDELRRRHDAGELPADVLCEVSAAVFGRGEKNLVRAQLRWLDEAARRDPAQAPGLVLAMSAAFGQVSSDVQSLAVRTVLRHARALDAAAVAELASMALALPADLRARMADGLGGMPMPRQPAPRQPAPPEPAGREPAEPEPAGREPAEPEPPEHAGLPPSLPARELPPPIGSPEELGAEIIALHRTEAERLDPVRLERVLAGAVALPAGERGTLASVLARFIDDDPFIFPGEPFRGSGYPDGPSFYMSGPSELNAITAAVVAPPARAYGSELPGGSGVPGWDGWPAGADIEAMAAPQRELVRRMCEIAAGLMYAPRPLLLSAPTAGGGLLGPGPLVDRLRRAAAEGWEPWPLDLTNALRRLPRDPDPDAAAAAGRLGTPAATVAAQRLSSGNQADPVVTAERRTVMVWTLDHGRSVRVGVPATLATVRSAPRWTREFELAEPEHGYRFGSGTWRSCWPFVLPAYRDVIAAHVLPALWEGTRTGRAGGQLLLPLLAEASGPAGDGTHLALAYVLGARDRADRSAAVDALVTLAVRGQLDGAAFGTLAGTLAARGELLLNRVVPGLRDLGNAGAAAQVWDLIAAALAVMAERPPRFLAELVELGVNLAEIRRPVVTPQCLASLAGRSGQLGIQARRLLRAIGS